MMTEKVAIAIQQGRRNKREPRSGDAGSDGVRGVHDVGDVGRLAEPDDPRCEVDAADDERITGRVGDSAHVAERLELAPVAAAHPGDCAEPVERAEGRGHQNPGKPTGPQDFPNVGSDFSHLRFGPAACRQPGKG